MKLTQSLLIALATIVGIVFYLAQYDEAASNSNPAVTVSTLTQLGLDGNPPNRFLEDSIIKLFNKQGRLEQQLSSSQIQYFDSPSSNDERVLLLQPDVNIQGLEAGTLQATSSRGELLLATKELHLVGNVLFQQSHNQQLREFRSSELMIDYKRKIAHTDKSVQVVQKGHHIDGIGMTADLNQGLYQLKSKVTGIHRVN